MKDARFDPKGWNVSKEKHMLLKGKGELSSAL